MKQLILSTLFTVCFTLSLSAQDAIYTANGNRLDNAQLIDITEDKVSFTVQRSGQTNTLNFQRQNVLFAFNKMGNFLVINDLSRDLTEARKQLKDYLSGPTRHEGKDIIVKAVPLTVLPAIISYESDDVVNYRNIDGKPASISKSELVLIIYKDGRHKLLREATDVAPLLNDVKKQLETDGPTIVTPAASTSAAPSSQPDKLSPTTQPTATAPTKEFQQKADESAVSTEVKTVSGRPSLDEADYQLYRKKALQKVDEFVSYLNIITDKKLPTYEKDKAIAQAAKLFMPAATIEVTSANRPGSRRYPIREYLVRLKLLPYSSAKIEWSEVQYIKEMSQAVDGNYYGVITGQQTFMGYGTNNDNVVYSDVTQKRVRVKLEPYQILFDGKNITKWNLLLGNIGVAAQ
ncbi:hypothetical protein [Spirosoma koreense]